MMTAMCAGSWSKFTCRASASSGEPGGTHARSCSSDIYGPSSCRSKPLLYKLLTPTRKRSRGRRLGPRATLTVIDVDEEEALGRRRTTSQRAVRRCQHVTDPVDGLLSHADVHERSDYG